MVVSAASLSLIVQQEEQNKSNNGIKIHLNVAVPSTVPIVCLKRELVSG